MEHAAVGVAGVAASACVAFATGLLVALGLIIFAGNPVRLGVVVAFVTGLAVAVFLSILAIRRSRKSTEA